jgi:hypothetical protein
VTWGKREAEAEAEAGKKDTFKLGKPTTVVTWGKRDDELPANTISLGEPSTEVTWS